MDKTVENIIFMIETEKDAILAVGPLFPERKETNQIRLKQLNYILKRIDKMEG